MFNIYILCRPKLIKLLMSDFNASYEIRLLRCTLTSTQNGDYIRIGTYALVDMSIHLTSVVLTD